MKLPLGIKPLQIRRWRWTNAHSNFTQRLKKGLSFDISVSDPDFKAKYPGFKEKYNQTTENLKWLIKFAIDHKIRLRAMGSGWSFSKIAVTEDGIINTKKLTLKAELTASQVSEQFLNNGGDPSNLLFSQCGNEVIRINELLEKQRNPPKSLRASGGSNGQTIVGAFSSGTHGAAFKYGALSEMIVGMHIVVGPDRHVWLERASNPVTSEAFRSWINAEVIIDDDLFNSALVSFGSFGIIHSVLLEVEPLFLLEQELKEFPYDHELEQAILFGDFSGLADKLKYPIEEINQKIYHFELAINPHSFQKKDPAKGTYFRVMYKQPYHPNYSPFDPQAGGKYMYGDDVLGLIQSVLNKVEALPGKIAEVVIIPQLVNALFKVAYNRPESALGTIGETFRNTIFRGRIFSAAYAFERIFIPEILDIVLDINKTIPFAGVIAMRFVKGTKATLGFTRFENSCVLEFDGADSSLNYKFVEAFTIHIENRNIEYGIHWGKINNVLNEKRIRHMYGDSRVDQWLNHRRQLLSEETRKVFNNEFLEKCGLDKELGVIA
ncbi:hypothetical protein BH23BAC1_BH23BAC1_12850 [soil metagenome]